jgi:hypothetical protein
MLFGRVSSIFAHDCVRVQLSRHHIAIDVPQAHDIIVLSNGEFSTSCMCRPETATRSSRNLKGVPSLRGGWTTTALDMALCGIPPYHNH